MAVKIQIQFNGKQLTLPINPEEIEVTSSADNEDIDIIGLGHATRKGERSLRKVTIESFFPSADSYFYTGVKPRTCVNFIKEIWKAKTDKIAKIVTTGLPINLHMYFIIESFTPKVKAGEEKDIYYTLEIKEYKPYGVKLVKKNKKKKKTRAKSTSKKSSSDDNKNAKYKVKKGDCLWNIAKAASGSGANWKELYNLNKKVIGKNPNLIFPRSNINIT